MTALISPIAVHSQVLRKELPLLTLVTVLEQELDVRAMPIRRAVFWLLVSWRF